MGGSLITLPSSPYYDEFQNWMTEHYENLLFSGDAVELEKQSRDYLQRAAVMNKNAMDIATILQSEKRIKDVFYPGIGQNDSFEAIKKASGGYSSLLSVVTHKPDDGYALYDNLSGVAKGPSLGAYITLVSLYTLLAHYKELEWAESQGIPSHLVRISAGIEDQSAKHFQNALQYMIA